MTGSDTAMKVNPLRVVGLLAADDELVFFDGDREIAHRKASHRERNAQLVLAELLDIVRRIAVTGGLVDPVQRPLKGLEAQEQRGIEQR